MNDRITHWFKVNEGDDFALQSSEILRAVDALPTSIERIVYTTKPDAVYAAIERCGLAKLVAVVGGYGLPNLDTVARLGKYSKGRTCRFLGDCDPADLLIFAWLRTQMQIEYLGVNDLLLTTLKVAVNSWMTIAFSQSETAAIPLLAEAWPDYKNAIGPNCAALLNSGRKLEVEAALNFGSRAEQSWRNLLFN